MYAILLLFHALFKWLVLLSLLLAASRAALRCWSGAAYTKIDNAIRHWTATIAHIQLILGMSLYLQSPVVRLVFARAGSADVNPSLSGDPLFFGFVHSLIMFSAIVLITIGSAMAKRKTVSQEKFRTMFIWFGLALLLILLAIPWPFSPLAQRPLIRTF